MLAKAILLRSYSSPNKKRRHKKRRHKKMSSLEDAATSWREYRSHHFKNRAGIIFDEGTVVTACGALLVVQQEESWSVILNKETVNDRTVIGDLGGKMEWQDIYAVAPTPQKLIGKKMAACRRCAERELYEESNGELDVDLTKSYYFFIPNKNNTKSNTKSKITNKYLLFVKFIRSTELPDSLSDFGDIETTTGYKREIILLDTTLFLRPPLYPLHMRLRPLKKRIYTCLQNWCSKWTDIFKQEKYLH